MKKDYIYTQGKPKTNQIFTEQTERTRQKTCEHMLMRKMYFLTLLILISYYCTKSKIRVVDRESYFLMEK